MVSYPAKFTPDPDGGFVITFRDVPEAITQGEDLEDGKRMALDALSLAVEFYIEDSKSFPEPSSLEDGEIPIFIPLEIVNSNLKL